MDKLRLGVLGLGEGRSIISAAINSELWELSQICDLNEDLCKERVAEFRLSRYTTKLEEMLADATVDVIGIYTPDPLHATHIKQCLQAGKHVICTKPLIDNLKDAEDLIEAQKKSGKHVFVGQSSRFFASMIRQRLDYDEAKHGPIFLSKRSTTRTIAGSCKNPGPRPADSNGFMAGFRIRSTWCAGICPTSPK